MNSLNILSARVIGLSSTASARPKSTPQDRSGQPEDYSRGRPSGVSSVADGKSSSSTVAEFNGKPEEADEQGKQANESISEKSPLLASNSEPDASLYQSKLQNLVKKIVDALSALLTTIGAPVIYVINHFKTDEGHYRPLPGFKTRRVFGGRKGASSTATAVGLSNAIDGTRALSRDAKYSPKLRTTASNESLASNTSESEPERKRSRPRSSETRQLKSRLDGSVNSRRSIRIQESNPQPSEKRKKKRVPVNGNEPLNVDSLKSPMATSQSLKIHKYPQAPAPPRPLIPRRQPSHSSLISRSPIGRTPPDQKTLIIDLDETLIHSLAKGGRMSSGHMVEVKLNAPVGLSSSPHSPVVGPQHPILYYVHKRPHCDEFLRKICQWYKLVVFTASVQEYADPVIDWLEQERKFFQGRYYRQDCTFRNGAYIKDLSRIESNLSQVIILDNSPMSYIFHEDNAIPIEGWISDPTDNDLMHLTPLLEALQYVDDVRALLALKRGEAEV